MQQVVSRTEDRKRRMEQKASARRRNRALAVAAAIIAVVAVVILADLALAAGRVHAGVSVDGVSVGGLRPGVARATLERELPRRMDTTVTIVSETATWTVTPSDVGLQFDFDAVVDLAMAYGRGGSVFRDTVTRLLAWVRPVSLDPTATADPEKIKVVLDEVAGGVEVEPTNAAVVIEGTELAVTPSAPGTALARDQLSAEVVRAFLSKKRSITVPVTDAKPHVSDADARAALELTERMIADPVRVTYDNEAWTFDPEEIASWISFRMPSDDSTATYAPYVDVEAVTENVSPKIGGVGREARDASFSVSNGRVSIIPSRDGVGPDMEGLALELDRVLQDPGAERSVELRTKRVEPKITTEKARTMGIKERLARYTTTYGASNRPRVSNIHLLADAIDGTLIPPGETFSFNETVGPRTAAKGYQEANAIVNGKLVPQLGGGICQVGTTLFNTVFESGLPVVQRRNHSFYISHYPTGRDATVSWGGPDLKFKNDTDNWVLLVTAYTDSSLTIALYGTDPGYEVFAETGKWQNVKPFSTEEKSDPTLPKGARVVEDAGVTGRTITVKRIVMKDDLLLRTDTFTSVYRPKTEVVRVGTKVGASKSSTSTSTTTP